jgi:hypothetical protein
MRTVISASRRTDLVAFFPGWLADIVRRGEVEVRGPRGRTRRVDLRPEAVHTFVLWSKDFAHLLEDAAGLRTALERYDQIYALFTITGLGGTRIEPGVPPPEAALAQLPALIAAAGDPRRVSLRFDPVFTWRDGAAALSNLDFFGTIVDRAARTGIRDVRFSFVQRYRRADRRIRDRGIEAVDPPEAEKTAAALRLARTAEERGLRLHACSQPFLAVAGVRPSACIDGGLLGELHPRGERATTAKDGGQRPDCGCTRSIDIGSYAQPCGHGCVYCYAQ